MVDVTVTYGGQQYLVDVPDTFGTLPPDQQRTDIQRFLGEQYPGLNITPPQTQPVDTSFGGAFRYGFDMPLENIAGTMEDFFGVDGSSLRNAIETNPNYRPASADFINPPEGAFTVGGYAPGYLPRTVAENIGQYGAALGLRLAGAGAGGAIGTAIAPGVGTTAGAVIGGFSLPTIFEAMQIASPVLRERLKNQGKTIDEATTDDYVIALSTAGFTGLANAFGTLGVGKIKGILTEAVTEGGQSVIQQTGETIATDKGLTIDPKQAVGEGIIGGATRGAFDATVSGVKTAAPLTVDAVKSGASKTADAVKAGANVITDPKGAYQDLKTTVKTIPNYRSVNELKNNPRLAESDARVADMFNEEKANINETRQGTDVAEDVVFKNIQDRLKNTFKEVSDALFKANKITGGEKKVFNQIVSRAAKHNRALTAPIDETTETDINEDISGGFETDAEFINNLDIDQSDKDTLLDALLDLETVTEAGMKNRSVGALTLLINKIGSSAGASAGALIGGVGGAAVGTTIGQTTLKSIAQRIDGFLGLNRPKVLKRVEARRKAAELIGRDYGNTPKDLADLIQRLLEQQVTVNTKQDKDAVSPEAQGVFDFLNEVGAPRAGGWLETVRQYVQKALEGTGVAVTQEDVLATIADLKERGVLDERIADDLILERGGQITIPKLIYGITDATARYVRERAGITPDAQAQAEADAAVQNAQSRRDARIQQGIEDNRRVLDASKTALEANNKIPKADKAKLSVALENMRLDLGRNPVEAIQNIVKDLRKSGVDEASIQAYILPYAVRVAQQQQQNDAVFSQVDPIPEVETAPASNPNRVSPSRPGGVNRVTDPMQENRQIGLATIEEDPKVYDKIEKKISKYVGLKDRTIPGLIEHAIDNLRYLYNSVSPEYRERARQWYVGANKLTQTLADQYSLSLEAVAGVMASLSPQKDWYMNYDLGVRTIEIVMNQQDTVFDADMRQAFVDMIENKDAKRSAKSKKELYEALKLIEGKRLRDIDPDFKGHFVRFYDAVYNPEKGHRVVTPEGTLIDFVMTQKGEKSGTAWNAFRDINKAISILENSSRENINEQLGEKHKVRSFYNNILDPYSPQGDVTIDTHAVAAALLRPLSGKSIEVLENFKDAGTSKNLGVFGSYGVYAEAYRRLAEELGIQPRELQSITWEAVRGLFSPSFKAQDENVDAINSIWQRYSDGDITIDQARSEIDEKAGGIDRAEWEDTGTQSGNAKRPNNENVVEARDQTQSGILSESRVYGSGSDGGVTSEPSGLLSRPTEEVNQQQEFDFDVNSIPTPTTTDGQAAREIKENLEEAEALIEIGKPGSLYEDGIKTYDQLNALLTALNLASNFHVVDSREDFDKLVDAYGSKLNEETREGTMGVTIQNQTDGSKAIIVMRQGRGGDRIQEREFLTILHEIAHAIEFQNRYQGNDPQIGFSRQPVLRPYNTRSFEGSATPNQKLAFHPMYDVSLRGLLNSYLNSLVPREVSVSSKILETDTEAFNNDPIVKEIRQIQADESISVPGGQGGKVRPFLSEKDYGQVYDTAKALAATRGEEPILTRDEFLSEKRPLITKQRETYTETAPEFTVDPVLFSLAEPKIAKKKYPNIYKFIQDVMNGKTPDVLKNTRFNNIRRDTNVKLYTAPFSVILAAVLSAMGMAEDEEEMPPVSPPNGGALTPQPGALSI